MSQISEISGAFTLVFFYPAWDRQFTAGPIPDKISLTGGNVSAVVVADGHE